MPALIISLFLLVFANPVLSQTLEPTSQDFNEELRPAALISGALVAGFQRAAAASGPPSMAAVVPPGWAGKDICVRVWTANGRYEARNEYTVHNTPVRDAVPIPFPTEHGDFLAQQTREETATLTSLGSCDTQDSHVTLTHWNTADGPVALLLNSFRADTVFVYVGAASEPVQCRPVAADIRSAFDVICEIDTTGVSGLTPLEIFRYTDRQAAPPVTLKVYLPGAS